MPAPDVPSPETAPAPCLSCMRMPRPGLDDVEGARVDPDLPYVVDAHVHLFPDAVFEAIWRWFEAYGWPIRYKLRTPDAVRFLLDRGVGHIVALAYAHKPGMARALNRYLADVARAEPRVTALGTVYPFEDDAVAILEEAFAMGLAGVKLHCHVQCFAPDDERVHAIYATCARHGKPLVIHAGREPTSAAYKCDPYALCAAERVARVLDDHPTLKLLVPHLGADEFDAYERLLERYDHLWLDTTMILADYFDVQVPRRLLEVRPDRVLYGSDFPGLPYAWDRELARVRSHAGADANLEALLGGNARALYGLAAS